MVQKNFPKAKWRLNGGTQFPQARERYKLAMTCSRGTEQQTARCETWQPKLGEKGVEDKDGASRAGPWWSHASFLYTAQLLLQVVDRLRVFLEQYPQLESPLQLE